MLGNFFSNVFKINKFLVVHLTNDKFEYLMY